MISGYVNPGRWCGQPFLGLVGYFPQESKWLPIDSVCMYNVLDLLLNN